MFPIKLTEHRYLNPEAIADIEYTPTGVLCDNPLFTVVFLSSQILPIHLKGVEAEEAFVNWNAAVDDRRKQADANRNNHPAKSNTRSPRSKS